MNSILTCTDGKKMFIWGEKIKPYDKESGGKKKVKIHCTYFTKPRDIMVRAVLSNLLNSNTVKIPSPYEAVFKETTEGQDAV